MPSTEFRKVGELSIYRSSLLHVAQGTFEAPDGKRFERDLVHHPGAVVVVPYDEATGEVVLVRQYRAPLEMELLEIPAGKRDVPGEPNELTAARELAEETGLAAERWEQIAHFYNSPGFSDEESWCYLARGLREVAGSRHGIEEQHMTVEHHRLADVPRLIRSGEITDAKTIVGLLLAQAVLAED